MTNIFENNMPFKGKYEIPPNGIPLPELIKELNKEINNKGNVIKTFKLNDIICDLNDLSSEIIVKNNDKIEILSDSPVNIARLSVEDVIVQLDPFVKEIDDIINGLVSGEKDYAFRKFTGFLGKFRDLIQLLQTIEVTFSLNYSELKYEDKTIQDFSENLVGILTEMKTAMENDDIVTLTDIMEYEIKEMFSSDLKKVLKMLSDLLSK